MRARRSFFSADSPALAQRLLGATLVRVLEGGARLAGTIVETEAYLGPDDTCAHSHKGRRTARTEPMFARPGTAYVYFTYGMHHCFNVVAGEVDQPVAVLIRALEPTEGLDRMHAHRASGKRPARPLRDTDLCSGPAKICQALAIDRALTGIDLTTDPRLFVESPHPGPIDPVNLVNDARIGVGDADDWARAPLRWHIAGNPNVSLVRTPSCGATKRPRANRE